MTHLSYKRNMVPKEVLMRSVLVSLNIARPVNTAQPRTIMNIVGPMTNIFNKAHLTVRRPINNNSATKKSNLNQKVNTAKPKAVLNVVKGNQVKTVNGEVQLQALVDRKKIIITESTVRRDLQLEDAEGVDCLPNATIFEQIALMEYEQVSQKLTFYKAFFSPQWKFLIHTILQCLSPKTTGWNEFSSNIASAIICLATNQKFNFSKLIFESMVKNLDNVGKFLMYPRFIQVFLNKQLDGVSNHKRIYVTPSHTKKNFRNIRRVGKGFSGRETPLFPTMMVQVQQEQDEGSAMPTDPQHTPIITQPSTTSQPKKTQKRKKTKRKNTEVPQPSGSTEPIANEAVNDEMGDSLMRAAITASILEVEQDSGGGPRCQETMRDTIAQTRSENVSKLSNDPLLARGNTLLSGEDSIKLMKLMEICTKLQPRVLDLETRKTTQANEIASLKRKVKKLERMNKSRTHRLKRLYKVGSSRRVDSPDEVALGEEDASKQERIADIDVDAGVTLESTHFDADTDMFGVHDLDSDEVIVEDVVKTVEETGNVVEEVSTAAKLVTLAELKSAKPKADKAVIQEPEQGTTTITPTTIPKAKGIAFIKPGRSTTTTTTTISAEDKGKAIMIEEPANIKKKDQISFDEQEAIRLQAKFDEEERLAREKDKVNVALTEEWDDIQAKIEVDRVLAERLQAIEQEELTDE
ncbi:hypothetical protein Tco_0246519 [Tanacetum coccineum]